MPESRPFPGLPTQPGADALRLWLAAPLESLRMTAHAGAKTAQAAGAEAGSCAKLMALGGCCCCPACPGLPGMRSATRCASLAAHANVAFSTVAMQRCSPHSGLRTVGAC